MPRARGRAGWLGLGVGLGLLGLLPVLAGAGDFDELRKRGSLRAVVWRDNLPELYAVKGTASGLEQEVLEGFARLHHLRVDLVTVPGLDDRVPALLRGDGDLVAGGLVNTEQRRKLVAFTEEIFPIRHVVVTRRPHPEVAGLPQLRGARVGTIKGSSWAEEVARAAVPRENVRDGFRSAEELMAALRAGTVDAIVMSAVWAIVEQRKDPELRLGTLVGPVTSVGFAVRKESGDLRRALDEHIANLRRSPAWSRLVVKYFGESGLEILKRSRSE